MNVTCPQCASVFRVDPAKVPEGGVRARCSVCSGLIAVRRPVAAPPPPPPVELAATSVEVTPPPRLIEATPPPAAEARSYVPVVPPTVPFATLPSEPVPEPSPPRVAEEIPPPSATARFANPFLQQDPATRARRLARALVSDLVVYHPEKRQRGLADGTLKELFSEEIRKSWEEYSEQVGEELATSTSWFTEALNEILAEGRPLFG